ncbi:hypothetical protein [Nocardia altamirensis]|uniref:hypothetical protein n=1 Tax=Nocardia altamirensis TaxID=472158 RepID=UPI00083FE083|nr:hypothetical protein [Nocardia altamirensis]
MPSRRIDQKSLSDTEIQRIAAAIAQGRSPTVWFTAAAVGITEGQSGKVVALADSSEPDHVRVRPAGSKDTLAFSPTELTISKPAHRHTTQRSARNTPS